MFKCIRDPCPDTRPDSRCTNLDEYVWLKDDHYSYELVEKYENYNGVTGYVFELNSQKWLDESIYVVKNHGTAVWKHWIAMWLG